MKIKMLKTENADDETLTAEFKFRVSTDDRQKLEVIAARKRTANSGIKLSDIYREAMAEYIERHTSARVQEEAPSRERPRVPRRSPMRTMRP